MILSPDFRERAHIFEKYLFIVKNNHYFKWDFLPFIIWARAIPGIAMIWLRKCTESIYAQDHIVQLCDLVQICSQCI